MVDMAVPFSPAEMLRKRHAIYRHLSQKDIVSLSWQQYP
jgi:glucosamine-6-phosphate deaminase